MARVRHPLISVVIPCFNEAEVIMATFERLMHVLGNRPEFTVELIFVDDGSCDGTTELLHGLHQRCEKVQVLTFARNFGHQVAVSAGLDHARGNAVVLIDADLQDPPELIPRMVERWMAGIDVVYGVRQERMGDSRFKRATAALFYRLLNRISEISIPVDTGDFRLMDRKVVDIINRMPERDRFIRGMVAWAGFSQEPLPYAREPRFAGTTKYPLTKMLTFALDGMSSFSTGPLRIATWCGFAAALIAFGGMSYAITARIFTNAWVPGWAALFVAVMFLGGIQLIALGIMGEYIGRIFMQSKARPLYVVQEHLRAYVGADQISITSGP
ncbi:MAG: glycosyltransferase family 2 protein [Gemmatimonadaceae bacterium]|nr:glycosyltransferase family 2 protein [Gemmatimonadaceae bacterium]